MRLAAYLVSSPSAYLVRVRVRARARVRGRVRGRLRIRVEVSGVLGLVAFGVPADD